jgi:hypothetical protein
MRTIGTITRLQIQRGSLKRGEKPAREYDPAPLLAVPALNVSPDGALGGTPDGAWIVDVHHRGHPFTKNEDGLHGISLGFTAHYDAMRERFGAKIAVGCAGENIIATSTQRLSYEELANGVAIVAPDGRERVRLKILQVAHPCRPFTGWALGKQVEPQEFKSHLQFLDNGMRGFYCVGEGAGTIALGDSVAVL